MIYIDNREDHTSVGNPYYEALTSTLDLMSVKYEKRHLKVGDLIITGKLGYVVTEHKGPEDYIASVMDMRRNNQLENMSRQLDHSLILITGNLNEAIEKRGANRNGIYSSLVGSFLRHSNSGKKGHIGMINVETVYDAALVLKYIQDKLDDPNGLIRLPQLTMPTVSDNDILVKMLMCIPGIGENTARELLKIEQTIIGIANSSIEKLCLAKGVGETTAKKVKYYLTTVYGLNSAVPYIT